MDLFNLIIIAYAPTLFILFYVYSKDRIEPEPRKYVAGVFLFSTAVSTSLALFLENLVPSGLIFSLAPFIEELTKMIAIYIPYRARQMDGVMDGVVYGVSAGLGFAALENLVYGIYLGQETAVIRSLLTPIAHSTFSSIVGVGLGLKAEGKTVSLIPYYFMGSMFHLWWNYSALNLFLVVPMFFVNIFLLYSLIRIGMREDVMKIEDYIIRKF